jgi:hypothetical protein
LLVLAGLSVLAFGCQLGESDVVRRSPDVGSWPGGSIGQDALGGNNTASDTAMASSTRFDSAATLDEALVAGEGAADAGRRADVADSKGLAGPVVVDALGEAGGLSKDSKTCSEDGYQFCEGFEDGAALWTETGGQWQVSAANSGQETNMVFGPTSGIASIAYVPVAAWQDMTVEARVMVTSFNQASSTNRVVLYARYQDMTHFYAVALQGDGKLGLRRNGTAFGTLANVSVAENEWHVLKLKVSGPADNVVVEGSLDGTLLAAATDTSGSLPTDTGTVGLGVYGGMMAVFDDVEVSSP